MRVGEAQEVPATAGKAVHRVGLAGGRAATLWAGSVDEFWNVGQWAAAVATWFVAFDWWQLYGQLVIWYGYWAVLRAVDDWDRCAPITLAANQPVADLIVGL